MNVALQISGDYNSERIFKIGHYLTKLLCVEHLVFTFFGHPVHIVSFVSSFRNVIIQSTLLMYYCYLI